jgi:adenylylsulfate kinase-like enzyme
LKSRGIHVDHVNGDNIRTRLLQPASSRGTRYAISNGEVEIASVLDEITQSVIVLFLSAGLV